MKGLKSFVNVQIDYQIMIYDLCLVSNVHLGVLVDEKKIQFCLKLFQFFPLLLTRLNV